MKKISIGSAFLGLFFLFFVSNSLRPVYSQEIDPRLFKPSGMVSVETAREQLKQIYFEGGNTKTLHCGCFFDKQSQVYPNVCEHGSKGSFLPKRERKILVWDRAMPISTFSSSLKCWDKTICTSSDGATQKGVECCRLVSPRFKLMESDMHNLLPAFSGDATDSNVTPEKERFGGMGEYQFCREKDKSVVEPREGAGGDIARAFFYMSYQYKVSIPDKLEDKLRMWHLKDPPDKWEEDKNSVIEIVQGNRNPFIDHPELAERVKDF